MILWTLVNVEKLKWVLVACMSFSLPVRPLLECVELWTSHFQEQSLPEPLSVNEIPERHCHEILNIYVSLA